MRYPTATQSECRDFGRAWRRGEQPEVVAHWVGRGAEIDLGSIEDAAVQIRQRIAAAERHGTDRDQVDRDQVEGEASTILYRALSRDHATGHRAVEVAVLDDPGFWRYLSLKWFWNFVEWREWKKPELFKESKHLVYVDASNSKECVLTRMYLRMAALGGPGHEEFASCLPKATDFWRSHILRVRTAGAPRLVRAMVESQRDARLKTSDLRELAKRVNRTWSNVLLDLYTQEESAQLLVTLRVGLGDDSDGSSQGRQR